jgi:hypothetical protein
MAVIRSEALSTKGSPNRGGELRPRFACHNVQAPKSFGGRDVASARSGSILKSGPAERDFRQR